MTLKDRSGNLIKNWKVKFSRKKTVQLIINETGNVTLTVKHLHYQGNDMICEGGILSIYFTHYNGIAHCGQMMGKVGRKSRDELTEIEAKWFFIDENYETKTIDVNLIPV